MIRSQSSVISRDLVYRLRGLTALLRYTPRYAIILIASILLLLALTYALFPRDDGTLAEIQQRGALRVGLDASFPPFETVDSEGQIVGLDVDIARVIAADLGVDLELVNIGFDGLYDALLARRVDLVISGLPYDPRWTQDVAYTRNYFNAGQTLVTLADNQRIQQPEDLTGNVVAVEWGSQADMEGRHLERELGNIELLRRATADEAIQAVLTGEADAAVVDGVTGVAAGPQGVKIVAYLTDEWYAAAVHIGSRDLLAAVNRTLIRLAESGEMAKMQAKWLYEN